MSVDVHTGEQKLLLKDARIGEIAFNRVDRSLMGVRHVFGQTQFVRIPYPYDSWQAVYTFPYGFLPYDLDISPDGRLLSASMTEPNADEFLRVWNLIFHIHLARPGAVNVLSPAHEKIALAIGELW